MKNIAYMHSLVTPKKLIKKLPISSKFHRIVQNGRNEASRILQGKDDRLLVVVGPCSIHDVKSAIYYAREIRSIIDELKSDLLIIFRAYFEKPRTGLGWKGLINDPHMDSSFDINYGLYAARFLLIELAKQGLPAATEFLSTLIPQYIADLISWGAIGARTTESQLHREMASGLSMPIGFKNSTQGDIYVALSGINTAKYPHHFLSTTVSGQSTIVRTKGNELCHLILRGGVNTTNYQSTVISHVAGLLKEAKINTKIMIDCSHGNSDKDHNKQIDVALNVAQQIKSGCLSIAGVMLESYLMPGKQEISAVGNLKFGQSITDACIGLAQTKMLLKELACAVRIRRRLKQHVSDRSAPLVVY